MAKLILMFKDQILNTFPLAEGDTLTIGRHPSNRIVIDNLSVSAYHARIEHRGHEIVLSDLDSKNGTLRNSEKVTQCVIRDKDVISIGKHILQADWGDTIRVELDEAASAAVSADSFVSLDEPQTVILQSPARKPNESQMPPPTDPPQPEEGNANAQKLDYLSFLAGGEGDFILSKKQVSFGKIGNADITVPGFWSLLMRGPAAVITRQSGNYYLHYAGGWIKPKRNGDNIKGTVKLNHADVVTVGPVRVQIILADRLAD